MLVLVIKDIYGNIHEMNNIQDYNSYLRNIEIKANNDDNLNKIDIEQGVFTIIHIITDDFSSIINCDNEHNTQLTIQELYDIIDTYNELLKSIDTGEIYKIIAYFEYYKNFENAIFSYNLEKFYTFKDTPVKEIIEQICNYYEDEDENNLYKTINYLSHIHPNTLNTQGVIDFLNIYKSSYVDNLYYIVTEY